MGLLFVNFCIYMLPKKPLTLQKNIHKLSTPNHQRNYTLSSGFPQKISISKYGLCHLFSPHQHLQRILRDLSLVLCALSENVFSIFLFSRRTKRKGNPISDQIKGIVLYLFFKAFIKFNFETLFDFI